MLFRRPIASVIEAIKKRIDEGYSLEATTSGVKRGPLQHLCPRLRQGQVEGCSSPCLPWALANIDQISGNA